MGKKRASRNGKQAHFKGMAPKRYQEIEAAADVLRDVRTERMALTKQETQAAENLLELMQKRRLKRYNYPDSNYTVEVVYSKKKVKVATRKDEED